MLDTIIPRGTERAIGNLDDLNPCETTEVKPTNCVESKLIWTVKNNNNFDSDPVYTRKYNEILSDSRVRSTNLPS